MKALVTGSRGHLGEALVRTLRGAGHEVVGLDLLAGPTTDLEGSIADRGLVGAAMDGVEVVFHTATLHKPHVATHAKAEFLDTNVSGTLVLLEAAVERGVSAFVLTSTTSAFGDALRPPVGAPAAWITEEVAPRPKNIYGVTKTAAEDLACLFHRDHGLPCVVLRTSRFFPEADDDRRAREAYADDNLKANELLFRRVDIEDVVTAHEHAARRAPELGFRRYVISATTPFTPEDLAALRSDAPAVVARRVPEYAEVYRTLGWRMLPSIERVYVNARARHELGWSPRHDFATVLRRVAAGGSVLSSLALEIGAKGYHAQTFADGPYPVSEPSG